MTLITGYLLKNKCKADIFSIKSGPGKVLEYINEY